MGRNESHLSGLFSQRDLLAAKFREFKRLLGAGEISREAAENVFQVDTLRQLAALTTHQVDGITAIHTPCGVEIERSERSSRVNISFPPSSVSLVLPTWSWDPPSNLNEFLGEERAVVIGERDEMAIPLGTISQVTIQGEEILLVDQSGQQKSLSLRPGINTVIGVEICHQNGMVTVIENYREFTEVETRTPDRAMVTQSSYDYVGFDYDGANPFTLLRAIRSGKEVFQCNMPGQLPAVMTIGHESYTIQLGLGDDAEQHIF